jgi:hypothetical protein
MVALGCLAFAQARRLGRWCAALTAMASEALAGNPGHFDDRIFAAKPHPGQRACARWIREDLRPGAGEAARPDMPRIQDRYSVRCAPHVIGVLVDALPWIRQWLEIEINGANDNPLLDPETGDVLHGGNFYGGHACFALDALKTAVANLADLVDRQMAQICNPDMSNGLPANLVGRTGADKAAHHGFKAMQISTSALAAEALKLTMPASVFSRSTECHNQDKVSMGTIAARDCLRVLELTETVAAIATLALCQAVDLRGGPSLCPQPGGARGGARAGRGWSTRTGARTVTSRSCWQLLRAGGLNDRGGDCRDRVLARAPARGPPRLRGAVPRRRRAADRVARALLQVHGARADGADALARARRRGHAGARPPPAAGRQPLPAHVPAVLRGPGAGDRVVRQCGAAAGDRVSDPEPHA